ncbi:MAG TPA: OmpA family protein [Myxococcota bacterium]|nr:OmpA family protein [Myxococcota bacterium]
MIRNIYFSLAAVVLAIAPSPALADQVLEVHLDDKVPAGKHPRLNVAVHSDLASLTLDLKRDDGKLVHQELVNVPRDSKRVFRLPADQGRHRYRGTLTVNFSGGNTGAMNLDFEVEVVAGLGLLADRRKLDLDTCRLVLGSRRPLAGVDYEVTADDGKRIDHGQVKVEPAARSVKISWKKSAAKVLKIRLVAHGTDGIFEDLELVPWSYSIPHQEVEFETGKWEIRNGEKPKLNSSYALLQKGLAKYGKLLDARLYVAGHTDTVASADYNLQLSEKRALAIAGYFRGQGFKRPIYYQGYGERGLKLSTPDETDEPRNRRAEYVLAAEPPAMNVPGSAAHWKRLY